VRNAGLDPGGGGYSACTARLSLSGTSPHRGYSRSIVLMMVSNKKMRHRGLVKNMLPTSSTLTSSSAVASTMQVAVSRMVFSLVIPPAAEESFASSTQLGSCLDGRVLPRQKLSVRPYPARMCRTGPRRRCRNNPSDCGPLRSYTRHLGYSPMQPAPMEGPVP
jgi:hypothetical protein